MWAMLKLKLRLMYNNKPLYLIMIAMAVILSGVFGNSFGSYKPTVVLVGTDPSLLKMDLAVALSEKHGFKVSLMNSEEAKEALTNRKVVATIKIPEGYPKSGVLEMGHWTDSIEVMQLNQVLQGLISDSANVQGLTRSIQKILGEGAGVSQESVKELYMSKFESERPLELKMTIVESDYAGYSQNLQALVGMTIFFLTYSVLFTVGDILEDQRLKTMNRFIVSPVKRWHVLMGNFIPGVLVGFVQMVVMVLSGKLLFGIDWGSGVPTVLLIGLVYVFAIAALSLFVVSIVRTMSQLGALSPVILTGMAMIGGCMWPIEVVSSKVLLFLSNFTPHRWAISAITKTVQTGTLSADGFKAIGIMLAMGLILFVLGERILYKKSQSAL